MGDFIRTSNDGVGRYPIYDNVIQEYEIYMDCSSVEWESNIRAFAKQLLWPYASCPSGFEIHDGYSYLTDSYESTTAPCFRMAFFEGPMDIENVLMKFGRATVRFNCKPQRFFYSGLTPIVIQLSTNYYLTNPSITDGQGFQAQPFIDIRIDNSSISGNETGFNLKFDNARDYHLGWGGAWVYIDVSCYKWNVQVDFANKPELLEFVNSYEMPSFTSQFRIDPDGSEPVTEVKLYPYWWTV